MKRIFSLLLLTPFAFQATYTMEEERTINDLPNAVHSALKADKEYSSYGKIPKDKDKLAAWMEKHLWNELPRTLNKIDGFIPQARTSIKECKKNLTYSLETKSFCLVHKTDKHNQVAVTHGSKDESTKRILNVMQNIQPQRAQTYKNTHMVAYTNGTVHIQSKKFAGILNRYMKEYTHLLHPSSFRSLQGQMDTTSKYEYDDDEEENTINKQFRKKFKIFCELKDDYTTIFDRDGYGAIVQVDSNNKATFQLFRNNKLKVRHCLGQSTSRNTQYKIHKIVTLEDKDDEFSDETVTIYISRINMDDPQKSPSPFIYNLNTREFKQADTLRAHPPIYDGDNRWVVDAQTGTCFYYIDNKGSIYFDNTEHTQEIEIIGSQNNIYPTKKDLSTWFKIKEDGKIKIYRVEPPLDKTIQWKSSDQLWLTALYYLYSKHNDVKKLEQLWHTKNKVSESIQQATFAKLAQLCAAKVPGLGDEAIELVENTTKDISITNLKKKECFNTLVAQSIATNCHATIEKHLNNKVQKERKEKKRKKQERKEKKHKEQERKSAERKKQRAESIARRKADADWDVDADADVDVDGTVKRGFGSKFRKPDFDADADADYDTSDGDDSDSD